MYKKTASFARVLRINYLAFENFQYHKFLCLNQRGPIKIAKWLDFVSRVKSMQLAVF